MFITLLVFLIILGLLIFVHEFGHFWVAKRNGVIVHEFAFGFKPRLFSWKRGETTYAINLIPLGGYVRLEGEDGPTGKKGSFAEQPIRIRLAVFVAGVVMNLVLAWFLLTIAYGIGSFPLSPTFDDHPGVVADRRITLAKVDPNTPAEAAGLQEGDTITGLNGNPITRLDELVQGIQRSLEQELAIDYERNGVPGTAKAVPRKDPPAGEGALGIIPEQVAMARAPWWKAPGVAILEVGSQIRNSFVGFMQFVGQLVVRQRVSEDVSGIIGVGAATGIVRRLGIAPLLQFTALISTSLAVINILPIPPLDGGHVFFAAIEAIRRKPVRDIYRNALALAGLAALVILFLVVTYQDVMRFAIFERLKDLF